MKHLLLLIVLFLFKFAIAQNEGKNWAFGNSAFIDFNIIPPKASSKISMNTRFGCASISSAGGKLLFYTQGNKVWGSNAILPNGSGLLGDHLYSAQSAIFVPYPDSSHLYYIFTLPYPGKSFVNYSIINLKLNSGNGDLDTNKKNISIPTKSMGKISAVKHSNRNDYWVLAPHANSNKIDAYLLTSKGIDTIPVSSNIGYKFSAINSNSYDSMFGYFKISPAKD